MENSVLPFLWIPDSHKPKLEASLFFAGFSKIITNRARKQCFIGGTLDETD